MKMTRRQLNEVITNYLLSEAEFGDFGGGVNIEFCDLSGIPKIFTAFFEPIRDRDTKKIKAALTKELAKAQSSQNQKRIKTLEQRLAELESDKFTTGSDIFAGIFNSATFTGLTKMLGPGLTLMTMMTKVDCDHIINMINIFTINVLAPLLGIEGSQLSKLEEEIKDNQKKRAGQSETDSDSGEASETINSATRQMQIFSTVSTVYKDNNVLDYAKRKEARESGRLDLSDYENISDVHLDFFELFSPNEYFKFLEDPKAEIPDTAKENFTKAVDVLDKRGHRDFDSFISAFVLATPGTATDPAVSKILKAANLKSYFESPADGTKFVKSVFNTIYKSFEFDGIQIFGL